MIPSTTRQRIPAALLAGRQFVFLGETGCGKSELAIAFALDLAQAGRDVHFFDLDQTKPLMRARDAAALLEDCGVHLHYAQQLADAPLQTGGLIPLLLDLNKTVILDVGGNEGGARLIGGYAQALRNAEIFFVVNPYRPWSSTIEQIDQTLSSILLASRLRGPRFLLNPTLGSDTALWEYLEGLEEGLSMLSPYVNVEAAAVPAALYRQVLVQTALPLIPITPHVSVPGTELD